MNTNIAEQLLANNDDYQNATHVVAVPGMSSPRICRFLNDLVGAMDPDEHYLEIGTWQGRTLLSAAYGNPDRTCSGCDRIPFLRLDGARSAFGFQTKRALYRHIERYRSASADIRFHHMTSKRFFAQGYAPSPIGVYLYDGDHSYDGTRHGVISAAPYLAPRAVLLIDDWNDPIIRRATADALTCAPLEVLWERQLDGDHTERTWWNGLGVFYVARTE